MRILRRSLALTLLAMITCGIALSTIHEAHAACTIDVTGVHWRGVIYKPYCNIRVTVDLEQGLPPPCCLKKIAIEATPQQGNAFKNISVISPSPGVLATDGNRWLNFTFNTAICVTFKADIFDFMTACPRGPKGHWEGQFKWRAYNSTAESGLISGPTNMTITETVGGFVVPVGKLGILAPYIGAAALVAVGAVIVAKKYKRSK
jgi:hypothetical protein